MTQNTPADTVLVTALLARAAGQPYPETTTPGAALLLNEALENFTNRSDGSALGLIAAFKNTIAEFDLEPLAAELKPNDLEASEQDQKASERLVLHLAAARAIYRENRGCCTPAEQFALDVLSYWQPDSPPLTPDAAESLLTEFRRDFDEMRDDARRFLARYPEPAGVA